MNEDGRILEKLPHAPIHNFRWYLLYAEL